MTSQLYIFNYIHFYMKAKIMDKISNNNSQRKTVKNEINIYEFMNDLMGFNKQCFSKTLN
jgi:hypothetical protein